jgi:hypothetical protein
MLISCEFCRSVASYQPMAAVSFAENGGFSGLSKDGVLIFGSAQHEKSNFF